MKNRYTQFTSVPELEARLARLEKRQRNKVNHHRANVIFRTKELIRSAPLAQSPLNTDERHHSRNLNLSERLFASKALEHGWTITKRGWPDYLCWKENKLIFVEVKPEKGQLSEDQKVVLQKLAAVGLKVYKWTPKKGFFRLFHKS